LLHGLTASPKQFAVFGQMLFERGHNVVIPRLPHHGYRDRMTNALAQLTKDELAACGLEALNAARDLGTEVTVVGFSTGGTVAAWLAQTQALPHVILVAPFLGSLWIPRRLTGAAVRLVLGLPNAFLWWDPIKRERLMPEHGYPRYSLHAAAQVIALAHDVLQAEAPPASERVTVVVNASETTVSNAAIEDLHRKWRARSGRSVELVRLTGLPASHDIIEPERALNPVATIYPRLLEIVEAKCDALKADPQ